MVEEETEAGLVINQPAGHLEANETLTQAAVRETLEETGWTVHLQGVIGLGLYCSPHNGVTYQRTTFFARIEQHHPECPLDDGIVRARWMSYPEIIAESGRMRSPLVVDAVERFRRGHRYPLEMVY